MDYYEGGDDGAAADSRQQLIAVVMARCDAYVDEGDTHDGHVDDNSFAIRRGL